MNEDLKLLTSTLEKIGKSLETLNKKFDNMGLDSIQKEFDNMGLDSIQKSLETLDKKFDRINARFEIMEKIEKSKMEEF